MIETVIDKIKARNRKMNEDSKKERERACDCEPGMCDDDELMLDDEEVL